MHIKISRRSKPKVVVVETEKAAPENAIDVEHEKVAEQRDDTPKLDKDVAEIKDVTDVKKEADDTTTEEQPKAVKVEDLTSLGDSASVKTKSKPTSTKAPPSPTSRPRDSQTITPEEEEVTDGDKTTPPTKQHNAFSRFSRRAINQFAVLCRLNASKSKPASICSDSSWGFVEKGREKSTEEPRRMEGSWRETRVLAEPYWWPHESCRYDLGGLSPQNTALVIIDMQRDFLSQQGYLAQQGADMDSIRSIIPNVQQLLHRCREANFPIYHTREGHRRGLSTLTSQQRFRSKRANINGLGMGDFAPLGRLLVRGEYGHDIIDELRPLVGDEDGIGEEPVIDKPARSAFNYTDFQLLLDIRGIKNLIICGVTTDQCVVSTMRDANDRGFDCLMVEDACWADTPSNHAAVVEMVKAEGGILGAATTTQQVLKAIKLGMSSPHPQPPLPEPHPQRNSPPWETSTGATRDEHHTGGALGRFSNAISEGNEADMMADAARNNEPPRTPLDMHTKRQSMMLEDKPAIRRKDSRRIRGPPGQQGQGHVRAGSTGADSAITEYLETYESSLSDVSVDEKKEMEKVGNGVGGGGNGGGGGGGGTPSGFV